MDPNSAYGEGKRVGELLCAIAHREHGLEATIARCFAFVGPHLPLDAHFAIGNFIRDTLKGDPIQIKDGSPYRSYLYAADLAIWLWTILFKGSACHPYNVGSEHDTTISQLAETVAFTLGGSVQVSSTSPPLNPSSVSINTTTPHLNSSPSRYVPDLKNAHALGLEVRTPLTDAIRKTAQWYALQ